MRSIGVVDVVDSTWFAAGPDVVAAAVAQPGNWARWWPGLGLVPDALRGRKGVRWLVPRVARGPAAGLGGSAEVWLEPSCDGVVAHFFLRLRPTAGADASGAAVPELDARVARAVEHHYRLLTKRAFWALADSLDAGRAERLTRPAHTSLA